MSTNNKDSIFTGTWTYRSFLNNPDLSVTPDKLLFGDGNIRIDPAPDGVFKGLIYGPGWQLDLFGSIQYGTPATVWFRGTGIVGGAEWIYDYLGYLVPTMPEGKNQVPAFVGSVTRAIPHPGDQGATNPAGVVCSFYAVKNQPAL